MGIIKMDNYIIEEYLIYLDEIDEILSEVPLAGMGGVAGKAVAGAAGAATLSTSLPYIMGAASLFSAFNMAFQLYKNYFTKAAKQCKDLPGKEKAICMLRAKALGKEAQLKALKAASAKCMKTKSPAKCKAKFNQKMSKVGGESGFLKSRLQQLSAQKYAQ